jgi:hypothetical protein
MPLQCLALMCTETKNCNGMNGNPIQGDNAYLLNVRLHREWSGEWLEAVFALCEITEFHQELVVWLCMHDQMLH